MTSLVSSSGSLTSSSGKLPIYAHFYWPQGKHKGLKVAHFALFVGQFFSALLMSHFIFEWGFLALFCWPQDKFMLFSKPMGHVKEKRPWICPRANKKGRKLPISALFVDSRANPSPFLSPWAMLVGRKLPFLLTVGQIIQALFSIAWPMN